MPKQYSCKRGRSILSPEIEDGGPGRFFLCGRCRTQVLICRCCDRGQIYCSGDCAREARSQNQRQAAHRYQTSCKGRAAHAERARRYRARQKAVTHHGLSGRSPNDHAGGEPSATKSPSCSLRRVPTRPASSCHWCGCRCSQFVRQAFLHRRRARRTRRRHPGSSQSPVTGRRYRPEFGKVQ